MYLNSTPYFVKTFNLKNTISQYVNRGYKDKRNIFQTSLIVEEAKKYLNEKHTNEKLINLKTNENDSILCFYYLQLVIIKNKTYHTQYIAILCRCL